MIATLLSFALVIAIGIAIVHLPSFWRRVFRRHTHPPSSPASCEARLSASRRTEWLPGRDRN